MVHHIFDSHAHYDDERLCEDRGELLSSFPAAGVCRVLNAGCNLEASRAGIALGKEYPFLYSAVGCHPDAADEVTPQSLALLRELAGEEKVKAIGEIGLDYHYEDIPRQRQIPAFEAQLQLAGELDMPVIIHSREAVEDTMRLLNQYRPKGVVHCFSGSVETAKEVLRLGMYIGVTGVITFKNARRIREVVEAAPLDRLLIETDCPYMAPEPYRGKRCDSTMLPRMAEAIAAIKGITAQEVADATCRNACRLFEIPLPEGLGE